MKSIGAVRVEQADLAQQIRNNHAVRWTGADFRRARTDSSSLIRSGSSPRACRVAGCLGIAIPVAGDRRRKQTQVLRKHQLQEQSADEMGEAPGGKEDAEQLDEADQITAPARQP